MKKQHGMSIYGLMYVLLTLGFVGYIGLKVFPAYLEYYSIKKIFATMANEEAKNANSVNEIRGGFDRRAVRVRAVTPVVEVDVLEHAPGGTVEPDRGELDI